MKKIRRGVLGIIYRINNNRHEFLLMRRVLRWKGWEFPKGGIRQGEEEEAALRRELEEETGMKFKFFSKMPYEIFYDYPEGFKSEFSGAQQSVYIVKFAGGDIRLSYEHDDFMWCGYDEAMQMLTHEGQKEALEAAVKALKGV